LFLNVCCLLSSCLHQSFKFWSPFLICGVRRFGNVLLDLSQLECSSWTSSVVALWVVLQLKHGGRQCWGVTENLD
jgi:hypothetical protein